MVLPPRNDPEFQRQLFKAIAETKGDCVIAEELRPVVESAMKLSVPPELDRKWKNDISFTLMGMRAKEKWLSSPFFDYENEKGGATAADRKWIRSNKKGFKPNQRVWQLTEAGRGKAAELGFKVKWREPEAVRLIGNEEEKSGAFDAKTPDEEREKILRSIVLRRGQPKFRLALLGEYERCVISGCTAESALEAAHIRPFAAGGKNQLSNGLLLRADLHTLFDLNFIRIDPDTLSVLVTPALLGTEYEKFQGKPLLQPKNIDVEPYKNALKERWDLIQGN